MHLHTEAPVDERLIRAGLELLSERGYKGATTRAIAERAGVAEVTLFRRFGSKANLIAAAVRRVGEAFERVVMSPSGDLRADLLNMAAGYQRQFEVGGAAVFALAVEASRIAELQGALRQALEPRIRAIREFFKHYQRRGELRPGEIDAMVNAFFGPLIGAAFFRQVAGRGPGLDLEEHVDGFIRGWSA